MFNGIHAVRWKLIDPNWIEYQLMWGKRTNPNLSWVLIYKKSDNQPLPANTPKIGG